MYAKGMSTRDIQEYLEDIYGIEASSSLISRITDKIRPVVQEWQSRPLEPVYARVVMDAIHYKVRQDGRILNKAAHAAIGLKIEGFKTF